MQGDWITEKVSLWEMAKTPVSHTECGRLEWHDEPLSLNETVHGAMLDAMQQENLIGTRVKRTVRTIFDPVRDGHVHPFISKRAKVKKI